MRLDGVPELLVFAAGQHEAGQFHDFVGREALRDGHDALPPPLD